MYTCIFFWRTGQVLSLNSNPVLRVLCIIYCFLLCFFSLTTATLLLLLLLCFSYCYYSSLLLLYFFPIAFFSLLLFFSCCCCFSHIMLLFWCDEVIKLLKLILINEKFNNQVLKTGCCCIYIYIWELTYLRIGWVWIFFDNLIGSHQPKKIHILENQSGSHNIMRELKPDGSHEKVRTVKNWFMPGFRFWIV